VLVFVVHGSSVPFRTRGTIPMRLWTRRLNISEKTMIDNESIRRK
jgi:hypothetical protein